MPRTNPPPVPIATGGNPYRDASGATLADYPRPSVAVDTAVLTLAPRATVKRGAAPYQLSVLLVRRPPGTGGPAFALPGTFLHEGETLTAAVTRSLEDKAGVGGGHPAQLAVFDDPYRDERGWVLSVAHLAVIRYADVSGAVLGGPDGVRLAPASRPGPLPYDHLAIVKAAVKTLRQRYVDHPDPGRLLGTRFSIRELHDIHEAIAGVSLQKDTFRRAMEPHLKGTGTLSSGTVGRPSQRFTRAR